MTDFTVPERQTLAALLELAIREDLGKTGDVTSLATIPATAIGKAAFVARRPGILAGLPACLRVIERVDPSLKFQSHLNDGQSLASGYWIATVEGTMRSILSAERMALNFLQHLSGIATVTSQYVDAVAGTKAKILDTRKTLPGWRLLEKYAVRMGGGTNHRIGLYDAILIKDNHIAAIRKAAPGNEIEEAVRRCRETQPGLPVEIEVDSLEQLERALASRPEIVLLDNMNLDQLRSSVARRDATAPDVLLEASGGVNFDTVRGIAETGVDRISVGALTHSSPALDIALDYLDT
ncbi:MAG: carboxylating nicotinate-nucleotide diphosphorylase [Planctomycetes bacterium]|nr:carboxylating nicotinate-nucleotide diphosphorylase [Planctomycetota bacterium]